jgi:16S rRNA A1518/A1519 N6-dimethyltransferase RsmA/KsgA/DIM1 with predicted DNA glycosylase/AP lyase activity
MDTETDTAPTGYQNTGYNKKTMKITENNAEKVIKECYEALAKAEIEHNKDLREKWIEPYIKLHKKLDTQGQ